MAWDDRVRFGVEEDDVEAGSKSIDVCLLCGVLVVADGGDSGVDVTGVEGDGVFAGEAELDGDVGAMTFTRLGQTSIERTVSFVSWSRPWLFRGSR